MVGLIKKALLAAVALTSMASITRAATITYTLSLNDNGSGVLTSGKYAIYADDSTGDNFGIAGFGISISGATSVANQSPKSSYSDSTGTNQDAVAGFTLLRSGTSLAVPVAGAQDNVNGPTYVILGYGQSAGNLAVAPNGYDTVAPNGAGAGLTTSASYKAHLLIATGNFNVATPVTFGQVSGTVLTSNLSGFVDPTVSSIPNASASVLTVVKDLSVVAPEPASLGVLALGGLALLARRRKVA